MKPAASIDAAKLRSFDLLTADTRMSKRWEALELSWADLVTRLSTPARFGVTFKKYVAMSAEERHALKDVGGWLAGRSDTGYRKASDVRESRLVRLDMDGAPKDWLKVVESELADTVYFAHTTASHSKAKPRVRVVLPLSRPVNSEEYAFVSRKLAARIGTAYWPDHSTFRHNQVAFWPSVASDGEWVTSENAEGRVVDVDAILGSVPDWEDIDAWPFPPSSLGSGSGKADDPRARGGWQGAFNRAHDIYEAIAEFIPSIYTPTSSKDRYSYAKGSLRNGLVVYDDGRYAYSHHEISDPAAGRLCDSWDLVRIHRFGHHDAKARERTPRHRLPSYVSMVEFAQHDTKTVAAVAAASAALGEEFDELEDPSWQEALAFDSKAVPLKTFRNLCVLLRGDPRLKGLFRYNELTHVIELDEERWSARMGDPHSTLGRVELRDHHVSALRVNIEALWRREWSSASVHEAISLVALDHSYHPILEILDSVTWDGVQRLDSWLIDYAEAPDNEYVRQVGRKMLVAAIARIREPGVKWDHMLLLHGEQGTGKSTLCRVLSLEDRFFAELRSVDPKLAAETINGIWIVEMCELEAFDRAQISVLKAFVTIQADRYRPAYGRSVEVRPRSCVVIGTTNEIEVLRDPSGNRRFWPVHTGAIDTDGLRKVVLQLYAEAQFLHGLGESLYLEGAAIDMAKVEQEAHRQTDPWEDRIAAWLDLPIPEDWYEREGEYVPMTETTVPREKVCVQEILDECLRIPPSQQHSGVRRRVGTVLRRLPGWSGGEEKPATFRFGKRYGVQRGWCKLPF